MSLIEKFHAIGSGQELKKFLVERFGWPNDDSCVSEEVSVRKLEQYFEIKWDDKVEPADVLTAIKNYYKTKGDDLRFGQVEISGSHGEISFTRPEAENYDSLCITFSTFLLIITINTCPYSYIGPSDRL